MFLSVLFLHNVGWSLGCWGGGDDESVEWYMRQTKMMDPNNKDHWGGWNAPPGAKEAWHDWLKRYEKAAMTTGGYRDPNSKDKPYGDGVPGFPSDWHGLGKPFTGMAPPPWAYLPINRGKPSLCSEPLDPGNCTKSLQRFAFNPFQDLCLPFVYTGCGGNRNNFQKIERCQKTCLEVPTSGCNPDSRIPVDYLIPS